VIVRQTATGEQLGVVRIVNDPMALAEQIAQAGESPEVVVEATYGWYWAADVLAEAGARVHLAHPLGIKGFTYRRVKNDVRDAADLADLLRMGRLPEAWIAPPATRELRELVRHRAKLVALRSGVKASVHAVLAKQGLHLPVTDVFGVRGRALLEKAPLDGAYRARVNTPVPGCWRRSTLRSTWPPTWCPGRWRTTGATRRSRPFLGSGATLAAVFVAEIGDVHRFTSARHLTSWAGLTPRHRESDTHLHRGHITRQGSRLLRWAAIEAVSGAVRDPQIASVKARIGARRGRNVGRVAAARHLLTLVYYGLRDGEIRCLADVA
jgi:transposase